MKFKLDENLPARLTRMLAGAGHDAISVAAQELGGQPDAKVAEVCRREGRVLLTLDAGFADIRAHPPQEHPGIIELAGPHRSRPRSLPREAHLPRHASPRFDRARVSRRGPERGRGPRGFSGTCAGRNPGCARVCRRRRGGRARARDREVMRFKIDRILVTLDLDFADVSSGPARCRLPC